MPATRETLNLTTCRVIPVKWKSRCVGFLNCTSVENLISQASAHFRLRAVVDELVLIGTIDGVEMELTNETLGLIPKGATVLLSRIRTGGDSDHADTSAHQIAQSSSSSRSAGEAADTKPKKQRTSSKADTTKQAGHMFLPLAKPKEGKPFTLYGKTLTGKTFTVHADGPSMAVAKLRQIIKERLIRDGDITPCMATVPPRLIYAGHQLEDEHTLSYYDMKVKCTVHIVLSYTGGKPVIYLFPPLTIPSATVTVRLSPQWAFTHLYPIPESANRPGNGSRDVVAWSVSASPDGTLVERRTGLELSYLFWEADTQPHAPPIFESDTALEKFDPAYPSLTPDLSTAVVLPFSELLPYLDRTLKSLSLHTAARNDFVTYWLPKLSRKPFIALRFLPQAAYERAASLDVDPKPDVVTRVFMLFCGLAADEAMSTTWEEARVRAGTVNWVSVVGVRKEAWDGMLFRVLEWGAMEVL
ncbi:hypothetical protein LXA43DRAFT_374932 [Ganoderma leucocontextum]|nr:hypothetical protein LXA43DRAFT_374932 [Ganoderma leucocontextum]